MSLQRRFVLGLSLVVFMSFFAGAPAQTGQAAAPAALGQAPAGGPPRGPRPKPANLQALPKDTSGDDVIKYMHEYEGALGVECVYCHAKNPETKRNDFPSDANPVKDKARTMIRMTAEINKSYLPELGASAAPVQCGTCHRGQAKPPAFVPKPEAPRGAPGAPAMKP